MSDITPATFPKYKSHPLLAELPDYLKDPKNVDKIKRAILDAGATKHSHGEMTEWAACASCQKKQMDRLMMMKKLGFKTKAHYMVWQKIHHQITELVPMQFYNS